MYLYIVLTKNWQILNSIIDAYATFFQFSCFKILCISFDLLIPTTMEQLISFKLSIFHTRF